MSVCSSTSFHLLFLFLQSFCFYIYLTRNTSLVYISLVTALVSLILGCTKIIYIKDRINIAPDAETIAIDDKIKPIFSLSRDNKNFIVIFIDAE